MKEKLMKSTSKRIPVSDIDFKQKEFCMSFNFDLRPLIASVEKFGVLNPPYLLKGSHAGFIVVAGLKRLLAVKELGWLDTTCSILPEDFSPFEALLLNLNDNLVHRQFNNIEKGMILQRLSFYCERQEIITRFMPILGIPSNREILDLYMQASELEEKIKVSLSQERLSMKMAGLLTGLDRDDRLGIHDLFTSLKWSHNQQWKLTQWIIEIASREGRPIKDIIGESAIIDIVHNERMNSPQKIKAIAKSLKIRRFPSLSAAEALFKRGLFRLSLPSGVNITPPPFFEETKYRLEIDFTTGQGLKETLVSLSKIPGLENITDFWKELHHQ